MRKGLQCQDRSGKQGELRERENRPSWSRACKLKRLKEPGSGGDQETKGSGGDWGALRACALPQRPGPVPLLPNIALQEFWLNANRFSDFSNRSWKTD